MTTTQPPGGGMFPRGRRAINGDPAQIVGPPWTAALYYFVLLAAFGVDIVAFHQVLVAAVDEEEAAIWLMVVGFTVVSLALSHTVGHQAKQALETRHVVGARMMAWLCLIGWAALGVIAFMVRWNFVGSGGTGTSIMEDGQPATALDDGSGERHLSAVLFLALYATTGLVSGVAGFRRHHPAARQYRQALSRRSRAVQKLVPLKSNLRALTELSKEIDQARGDHLKAWFALEVRCRALAERLKSETRFALIHKTSGQSQLDNDPHWPDKSGEEKR